jgi:hypothetical protein
MGRFNFVTDITVFLSGRFIAQETEYITFGQPS